MSIEIRTDTGQAATIEVPNECPHCGRAMSPRFCFDQLRLVSLDIENPVLMEVFQCVFEDCRKYFSEFYLATLIHYEYKTERLGYSYSGRHVEISIPRQVSSVSPLFFDIYSQSVQAENDGLNHISGIGYRKALEFLVKDYAIAKSPDREEQIKSKRLGSVIADELTDFPKLQQLAKAANWIGTDKTHYVEKYSDNDIEAMKRYINSAATFIAADIDVDEAANFIHANDPKAHPKTDEVSG